MPGARASDAQGISPDLFPRTRRGKLIFPSFFFDIVENRRYPGKIIQQSCFESQICPLATPQATEVSCTSVRHVTCEILNK